jgi:hypothetical protein
MTPDHDDEYGPMARLISEFGDQPVTWDQIGELFPEVTTARVMAFLAGDPIDTNAEKLIECVLAWRPWLRSIGGAPVVSGEMRVRLHPQHGEPTDHDLCWSDDDGHALRLKRKNDRLFAVYLERANAREDVTILIDGHLVFLLPARGHQEWARVAATEVQELIDGSAQLDLGIRPGFFAAERRTHGLTRAPLGWLAAAAMLLVSTVLFLMHLLPMRRWRPGSDISVLTEPQAAHLADRLGSEPGTRPALFYIPSTSGGPGSFMMLASLDVETDGKERAERNCLSILPPSGEMRSYQPVAESVPVGRWYLPDPFPRLVHAGVADMVLGAQSPGPESFSLQRDRMRGIGVFRVHDAHARVLRELWNIGYIYSARSHQQHLLLVASSNRLPQTVAQLRDWETHDLFGNPLHRYPNVFVMLDLARLPARGVLFPATPQPGYPLVETELFLAQPSQHGSLGLRLQDAQPSARKDGLVTLVFTLVSPDPARPPRTYVYDIDAAGRRVGGWRERTGADELEAPESFADLVPVRDETISPGLLLAENRHLLPGEVVLSLAPHAQGDSQHAAALEIAKVRADSVVWRLEELYELLATPSLPRERYLAAEEELSSLLRSRDERWAPTHRVRMDALRALVAMRLGRQHDALTTLDTLPIRPAAALPTSFEIRAVTALVRASADTARGVELIRAWREDLARLNDQDRWLVESDARTMRLIQEAETRTQGQQSLRRDSSNDA